MAQPEMNPAVDKTFQDVNGNYPVAEYTVNDDGSVDFTCDDGDTGRIEPDGDWDWTS